MIKPYLLPLLLSVSYSGGILAQDSNHESPFISSTQASVMAMSATTGFMVPMSYSPLLQAEQLRQLQFQASQGLALPLANRRAEYLAANLSGRQHLAEQIGDTAARQYAKLVGYQPLFQGAPGQGKGFDQVYKVGKQIVVLEAKGGASQPKIYYGHRQGTAQYSLAVARRTLASTRSSPAAKQAATEVLKAYQENRLVVQVASTPHVYGQAQPTVVNTTYGQVKLPSPLQIAHQAGVQTGLIGAGLAGGIDLLSQLASGQPVDWQRTGNITLLGGVSGYAGSLSGTLIQNALMTSQSKLLATLATRSTVSSLVGGVAGGVVGGLMFSYGSYLLGYSDWRTANREGVATLVSYGTWALGGAVLGGGTAVAFATTIAGAVGATASTGTAIASLSGAAAAKATLAALGGGSIAAGGGGVAAGTAVLAGITATGVGILAIGAGAGVMYMYHLGDEKAERERVAYLLAKVKNRLEQPS
jgi:hypothetical protein